jgi:hypothetical protein
VPVCELADGITAAQRNEIKEMDWLVRDIEENGPATTPEEAEQRPVPDFEGTAMDDTDRSDEGHALLHALLALPFLVEWH